MSVPTIYICDDFRANELAVGEYLHRVHKTRLVLLSRSNGWKLPGSWDCDWKGQKVLYVGTYNIDDIKVIAKYAECTTYVFSAADVDKVPNGVTDKSLFTYVKKIAPTDKKEHERLINVVEIFDQQQVRTLTEEENHVIHGIKTGRQPTLHDEIKVALNSGRSVQELAASGKAKCDLIQFVISQWYKHSYAGVWEGYTVRVCHAGPFLIEVGDYCKTADPKAGLIVLYRTEREKKDVEREVFRFTLISADPKKFNAKAIAEKYGGGGEERQAGFALNLVEGAKLLESIK